MQTIKVLAWMVSQRNSTSPIGKLSVILKWWILKWRTVVWQRENFQSIRRAIITLIFKKEDPEELKNWRPISLLTADYKIIAKVLANRLKNVMRSLIHPDQTCSVPGRSSERNATLLRDISDYVASKNTTCAFLAIDQEKAFDSVDWEFMHRVLDEMNFGPCLRGMVECLYTDIQSAILSNGHLANFFDVHRGVRQWFPPVPDIIRPSRPNM